MSFSKAERYAAYKDSGVEWLGEIPADWETKRLKDLGCLYGGLAGKSGRDFTDNDIHSVPFIPFTNIANNFYLSIKELKHVIISPEEKQNAIKKNDLFFLMSSEGFADLGKSSLLLENPVLPIYLNSFCKGFRFAKKNIDARFINYLLHSSGCRAALSNEGRGFTRINLRMDKINDISLCLPPALEQSAIAAYLDAKTAQIDRKIELLSQKATRYSKLKQSIINETVTRGLDKSVPMKDSSVEWIGEVPEHWAVTAITNVTEVISRKNHPNEELLSVYRDFGVIIKSTRDDNHNKAGSDLSSYKLVEPGFLVINKMKAWQGSLGVSEFRGIVSPAYITCKTNKKIVDRGYLHHLLRCRNYINEYNRLSFGVRVNQWDMRYDDFKYVPVLLPPMEEQAAIAKYLDKKMAEIDLIVTAINNKIDKLKDMRKALINDVVTGKIKAVSEEAAV